MDARASKAIDSIVPLVVSSLNERHTSPKGLLIASKDFLRVLRTGRTTFRVTAACSLFSPSHALPYILTLSFLVRSFTYIYLPTDQGA